RIRRIRGKRDRSGLNWLVSRCQSRGPDGFKVFGGEGRIDARQVNATTLVLVPTREIGPERIPLAVGTAERGPRPPWRCRGERPLDGRYRRLLLRRQVFAHQSLKLRLQHFGEFGVMRPQVHGPYSSLTPTPELIQPGQHG